MATSLFDLTVPVYLRGLANLSAYLEKGRAHAEATGMPESELIEARLIEDMHPLPSQIQRASDFVKLGMVRIAQVDNVSMADDEKSFGDLQARIARTVEFLKTISPDAVNGREDAMVEVKLPSRTLEFRAIDYVQGFVTPNFYFHLTTAYALLRMKGVPIGKMDFMGGA